MTASMHLATLTDSVSNKEGLWVGVIRGVKGSHQCCLSLLIASKIQVLGTVFEAFEQCKALIINRLESQTVTRSRRRINLKWNIKMSVKLARVSQF